ncbi:hypothetical protein FB45DRAFT_802683 [Roridomyces roridus]|uniref:DUF7918 domain-containing protein n=1 Tax=Roridomyces roridus TaxID=1738132 RepID=A0AAD7B9F0_9AGAR|nr:hypothetical protein FB45DRAFT_802683 [Roridomyces roridus]
MQLGQFSASVSVDGVTLSEYAPEYSADGTEATRWIPSQNDKCFRVQWSNDNASKSLLISGRLNVDGIKCPGKRMAPKDPRRPTFSQASRDSVPTSAATRRPLMFSKQALTDDDEYLNASISPHLGTIRLQMIHVKKKGHTTLRTGATRKDYKKQILHEKSKKAVGHAVQFGAEFRSMLNTRSKSKTIKKLVTFIFKYRPIELLRADGVAPRPVEEERAPPTEVLDLTMDTEEDAAEAKIKELEAQLEELKKNQKRVKQEPSVKKEIKTESQPVFQPGEVIDLT